MTLETSIKGLKNVNPVYPEAAQKPLGDEAIHLFVGKILERNFAYAFGIPYSHMLQAEPSAKLKNIIVQIALNRKIVVHVDREEQTSINRAKFELRDRSIWEKIEPHLTIRPELTTLLKECKGVVHSSHTPPASLVTIHLFVGKIRGKNLQLSRWIPDAQIVRIKSSTSNDILIKVLKNLTSFWPVEVHVDSKKILQLARVQSAIERLPNLKLPRE